MKISWGNVLKAVKGENFEYTGKPDKEFFNALRDTVREIQKDTVDEVTKKAIEDLKLYTEYHIKSSIDKYINKEQVLDSIVKRIKDKQLN